MALHQCLADHLIMYAYKLHIIMACFVPSMQADAALRVSLIQLRN